MNSSRACFVLVVGLSILGGCGESGSDASGDAASVQTGTGDSTARMAISGDYLYAIADSDIQLFDIETPSAPNPWTKVRVSWSIETLFPYQDEEGGEYLLIGASDGFHILDNSNPGAPEYLVDFPHAQAQDPLVAENGIAYVTLKDGKNNQANAGINQLNIVDIASVADPQLLDAIPLQGPTGLSVDEGLLFVCDNNAGIKIFDTKDSMNISVLHFIPNVNCNDVIAKDNTLFVITDDSVLQYDYSSLPPKLISQINKS